MILPVLIPVMLLPFSLIFLLLKKQKMSRTKRFFFFLGIFFVGVSLHGQQLDTVDLSEVVVVHSKVPVAMRATVKPVTIISRASLERQAGKDLAQILQAEAGILVNGAYSNPGKDKSLYIRGAGSEFTLILIDGQPLLDASGVGGAIDLRLLNPAQLERIEILKGSHSTLYGSDAVSGVINLVTRGTSEQTFAGHVSGAWGSLDSYQAGGGVRGRVGRWDYRVDTELRGTEGISEAIDEDPATEFDRDGFAQRSLHVNMGYKASDALAIRGFFRDQSFEGDFDDGAFSDAANTYTSRLLQGGLTATYKKEKTEMRLTLTHMDTDRRFATTWGQSDFKGYLQQVDLWWNYTPGKWVQLLGGINGQYLKMVDPLAQEVDPDANIWSAYVSALLKRRGPFSAEAGYRINRHSSFGLNHNVSMAANYHFNDNWRLFGSFTTGFKAPNLSQLYGQYGANPELEPQLSQSLEGGIQFAFPGDPFYAQLAYFQRNINNLIAYDYFKGFFNQSRQEDRGIELETHIRVQERLHIRASWNWLTGQVRTPLGADRDTTYNNLFRRPEHQLALGMNYQPGKRWNLDVQWQQIGLRQDLFFNPANFYTPEAVDLAAYGLLNAYVSWEALPGKMKMYLDVKNITNKSFQEIYGFASLGRNILVGVNLDF